MKKSICILISVLTLQACYEDEVDAGFDYQSGDVITMVPSFNSQTDSVEFYWDNEKIAIEKVPPFVHEFLITNDISSGTHKYSIKIFFQIGNYSSGSTEKIQSVVIK